MKSSYSLQDDSLQEKQLKEIDVNNLQDEDMDTICQSMMYSLA